MSEWWSYSLSDFLLFSPRTYYRLFELYNLAIWPAHILAFASGAAILGILQTRGCWQGRAVSAILAACWLWVAWAYLWERYATINWAASYLAIGFLIQGALLFGLGVRQALSFQLPRNPIDWVGRAVFVFALAAYPLIGPLLGRPWSSVEVFGIAPDPTAVGTLGILLLAEGRVRWEQLAIPLLWCSISGATLWTMGSPDALAPMLTAVLVFVVASLRSFPGLRSGSANSSVRTG